ncbi:YbaK/EbsC family protein [Candidatus Woesearchaeota archaeon]|nr:YbaK/EbsC family protein [Candidatus Woesearchaeota archaeon]
MAEEAFKRIKDLLDEKGVEYEHYTHDHVHSSKDAAKVRGTRLEEAAKALILKDRKSGRLSMFIVGGDRKLDLKTVKKDILGTKNVSLAPADEVLEATGCAVGSVPPFGQLFSLPVYFDRHLEETQEHIVFSAGTHHDSIRMRTRDFLSVVQPAVAAYSKPYVP